MQNCYSSPENSGEGLCRVCDEHLIPQVLGTEVGERAHSHSTEIMLGRTLTLERARQLNSRTFFYEMLKDNPTIAAIRPGVEDELMDGAIDCHIHAYPDFVHRAQDMFQIAIDASRARMRAIAFKDHWNLTAGAAYLVQRYVDDLVRDGRLEHRVEVYGGLGLNHGINPEAVRIGLQYPNLKLIWFPTFKSYGWARFAGVEQRDDGSFVRLVGADGNVLPDVRKVFELAAAADVVVSLGHTDFEELLPLCTLARDLGAYVGTYCQPMIPSLYQPIQDPMETVAAIRAVGPDRCVTASDFGQVLHVNSIDGVRIFIRALLGFGVPAADISTMVQTNPARLLGLS